MSSLPSARWGGGTIRRETDPVTIDGDNHAAFSSLLAEADVDAALILARSRWRGSRGGAVVPAGSALYVSLERYLELLEDKARRLKRGTIFGQALRQSRRRTPSTRHTVVSGGNYAVRDSTCTSKRCSTQGGNSACHGG